MSKNYETKEISNCCRADVYEDYDEDTECEIKRCDKCDRECETTEACSLCNGTGKIERMVYTNNEPDGYEDEDCICNLEDDDPNGGDGQDD